MRKILFLLFAVILLIIGCKKDSSTPSTPTPTTGTIAGKIVNASGDTVIAGAAISTTPATGSVFTDANGAYSISDVSPGTYSVNVTKSGFYDGSVSVKVSAGSSTTANIQLTRIIDQTGMIKGKVTNAGGDSLIVGASITTSPATSSVTTDAQGLYIISNVPIGAYTITATKSGYNAGNTAVTITTGKISTGDIKMNVLVNHAPSSPVLVSPSSGTTGQDRNLTITWTCSDQDGDNITYDIYLDKNTMPVTKVSMAQTATSYTASNLDSASTYYWKVIAKDSKGAVSNSSVVNSFVTINLGQGLVAFYPFNGNANDASGNGNNGVVLGATLTKDRFNSTNRAYSFNGTDNYITIPSSSSLISPRNSICISVWIKINDFFVNSNGTWVPVLAKSNISSEYGQYQLLLTPGAFWFVTYNNNNSYSSFTFAKNVWYSLICSWDGTKISFYLNGTLLAKNDFLGTLSGDSKPIELGRDSPGALEYLNGILDDIRIYNRALSIAEIQSLYHEGGWIGN